MAPDTITVLVLKYDGAEYRRWHAREARREGSLLVLDAEFEYDVEHHLLGHIKRGTRTIEYYWLDRWYNVFRFLEDNGSTRLWYCNINTPPTFVDGVLSYIDLDIDIVVQPDLSYRVLDLDEFERNAERFEYSDVTQRHAQRALEELLSMIETHRFPFAEDSPRSSVSCSG
jgi:protein associated with RNAse G/E